MNVQSCTLWTLWQMQQKKKKSSLQEVQRLVWKFVNLFENKSGTSTYCTSCSKSEIKLEAVYIHSSLTDLVCQDLQLQGKRGFAIKTTNFVQESSGVLTVYAVHLSHAKYLTQIFRLQLDALRTNLIDKGQTESWLTAPNKSRYF